MVSISFNNNDLSDHGLEIHTLNLPLTRERKSTQLEDREFSVGNVTLGKTIQARCRIFGDNLADLLSNIDNINKILNVEGEKKLEFGHLTDRYWMAEFESISGPFTGIGAYEVELAFFAADPYAYSISVINFGEMIKSTTHVFNVTTGGTAPTRPKYLLIPLTENINSGIIQVTNKTTNKTLKIEHSGIVTGSQIIIDTEKWIVKLDGSPIMTSIEGEFPILLPGTNLMEIKNGGLDTYCNVEFYNRYV